MLRGLLFETIDKKESHFSSLTNEIVLECRVVKMSGLWKKYTLVCFVVVDFLQLISTVESEATHLFSRNIKYHELSYIKIAEPGEPETFHHTNTFLRSTKKLCNIEKSLT
jgi:hypothetical protein